MNKEKHMKTLSEIKESYDNGEYETKLPYPDKPNLGIRGVINYTLFRSDAIDAAAGAYDLPREIVEKIELKVWEDTYDEAGNYLDSLEKTTALFAECSKLLILTKGVPISAPRNPFRLQK